MWFGYVPQIKNTNVISARGLLLFSFPSQLALSHILRKPDPPNSLHPRLLPSTIIPCQPNRVFPFSKTYIYIYIEFSARFPYMYMCELVYGSHIHAQTHTHVQAAPYKLLFSSTKGRLDERKLAWRERRGGRGESWG